MAKPKRIHNFITNKEMTRKEFLTFCGVLIITVFGVTEIIKRLEASFAETPYATAEAEAGTLGGSTTKVTDSAASGGQAIKFGSGSTGSGGKIIIGAWTNDSASTANGLFSALGISPSNAGFMEFGYGSGTLAAGLSVTSMISSLGSSGFGSPIYAEVMQFNFNRTGTGNWAWATDFNSSDGSTSNGKTVTYNDYYTAVATACYNAGVKIIRLGWEFNDSNGQVGPCPTPTEFLDAWSAITGAYNAVAPNYFSFIFNPDKGSNPVSAASGGSFPVSDYIPPQSQMGAPGIIALDAYDFVSWSTMETSPWSWNNCTALANQYNCDVGIGEWGMTSSSGGLGDQPSFVSGALASAAAFVTSTGRNAHLNLWAQQGTASTTGEWSIIAFPNSYAELKSQITSYQSQGLIAN